MNNHRTQDGIIAIALFILLLMMLASCSATKNTAHVASTVDSVKTEVRYERLIVRDTVYIELPKQSAERTTTDSVSVLETDFAISTVEVSSDGTVHHTIDTKTTAIPTEITTETITRDSIVYVMNETTVEVEVERELTTWQRICVKGFPWLLLIIILAFAFIFRKQLSKILTIFAN